MVRENSSYMITPKLNTCRDRRGWGEGLAVGWGSGCVWQYGWVKERGEAGGWLVWGWEEGGRRRTARYMLHTTTGSGPCPLTSHFSLYGSLRYTSGAMYMQEPVLPVSENTHCRSRVPTDPIAPLTARSTAPALGSSTWMAAGGHVPAGENVSCREL